MSIKRYLALMINYHASHSVLSMFVQKFYWIQWECFLGSPRCQGQHPCASTCPCRKVICTGFMYCLFLFTYICVFSNTCMLEHTCMLEGFGWKIFSKLKLFFKFYSWISTIEPTQQAEVILTPQFPTVAQQVQLCSTLYLWSRVASSILGNAKV